MSNLSKSRWADLMLYPLRGCHVAYTPSYSQLFLPAACGALGSTGIVAASLIIRRLLTGEGLWDVEMDFYVSAIGLLWSAFVGSVVGYIIADVLYSEDKGADPDRFVIGVEIRGRLRLAAMAGSWIPMVIGVPLSQLVLYATVSCHPDTYWLHLVGMGAVLCLAGAYFFLFWVVLKRYSASAQWKSFVESEERKALEAAGRLETPSRKRKANRQVCRSRNSRKDS